jgi:hypothetical protein
MGHIKFFSPYIFLWALLTPMGYGSSYQNIWNEFDFGEPPKTFEIVHHLEPGNTSQIVLIRGGSKDGIVQGAPFRAYRSRQTRTGFGQQPEGVWVATGILKAIDVQETQTLAKIVENGTDLSQSMFPKFPGIMAGDLVVSQKVALARRQILVPTTNLSFFDLFEDPAATPSTFELKSQGREKIKGIIGDFAKSKLSLLMVEGHTDHNGPGDANQIESYQRALTVRQYLIDDLGFDPKRVIAIGYGESEPIDESSSPGYVQENRRITLKAMPMP